MGYRSTYRILIELRESVVKTFSLDGSIPPVEVRSGLRSMMLEEYEIYVEWLDVSPNEYSLEFGIVDSRDNDEEILQFARDSSALSISYWREGDDREDVEEWSAELTTTGVLINKREFLRGHVMEKGSAHHRLWKLAEQKLTTEDKVALELILSHYGL